MRKMDETLKNLIRLSMIPDIGTVRIKQLLDYFGSPERILEAGREELKNVCGIGTKLSGQITDCRDKINVEEEIKKIERNKVSILTIFDKEYPANLKSIFDPPVILYVKGNLIPEDNFAIAIVGTRQMSTYGKMVTETLSKELAKRNVTIVSGLARGIDSIAHRGALSGGGRTVAVLGSGIDICYPPENKKLFEQIIHHGAVISEFPMSTKPDRGNFPSRNRIISGLSLGTVIIEAGKKSGALITADAALEQGREVFAVPGNIFTSNTKGTHSLIKQGAKLVETCEDIIEDIDSLKNMLPSFSTDKIDKETSIVAELNKDEEKIYNIVSFEPMHIDLISEKSNLPVNRISPALMELEIKGKIKEIPGKMFVRTI